MKETMSNPTNASFPRPPVLKDAQPFIWSEDGPVAENYVGIARRLAAIDDLYRSPQYAAGLLLASKAANVPPMPITSAASLGSVIADRVAVVVVKDGKPKGTCIPSEQRALMLRSELFLQEFLPVDTVTRVSMYLPDFRGTEPGYNDGGPGHRILHVGALAPVSSATDRTTTFLDAMDFASNADRTNALAAAVTVSLRNLWPGAKPVVIVTANKSHAGKDTLIAFAAGRGQVTSVSYQNTDWALERAVTGTLKQQPDTAVLNVENARLDGGRPGTFIASGFLERFVMNPKLTLFSTGTGAPVTWRNDLVLAITSNDGSLSPDLMNRSLPIRLEATGCIEDRHSPIGNPKLEYLPAYGAEIEAEIRGMIERWKDAGRPLDDRVRHPFTVWAKTVGGILRANDFDDFLANYSTRKAVDDPLRQAVGLLGSCCPDTWLSAGEWVTAATHMGLTKRIVPGADFDNDKGRERGMGVRLSALQDEKFTVETDDERLVLHLKKGRRRFVGGTISTRYRFDVLTRTQLPADPEPEGDSGEEATRNEAA